ncbi:P-loop containing nucleoside triphosphate hydrolase protein [Polychytrium aggregatum]|uniref:P-loop containing nucleoside triphosphate hydrolase protein n=1 Tax=Polychytrium aggregatum TaxID=110093 RepID=UPI0022FF2610|nr:P-loop containing nucleoside triphosphate hydrolase protein [Polychytrium aggregatum]KAI9207481.1 P-loop containing nucleoside triphosphate hydrolase protein [Polychytrium aggregatum]
MSNPGQGPEFDAVTFSTPSRPSAVPSALCPRFKMTLSTRRKLVIVGDGSSGKTSLLAAFSTGRFLGDYVPTIFENSVHSVTIDETCLELALWDTAGQEGYERLRTLSYTDTDVVMICFSIDSPDSLDNVEALWVPEIRKCCASVPIILAGCKADLRHSVESLDVLERLGLRPLSFREGLAVANSINAYGYVETSAKTTVGVKEAFELSGRAALTHRRTARPRSSVSMSSLRSVGRKVGPATPTSPREDCVVS